jgi:SAM-dependent methyltransferase
LTAHSNAGLLALYQLTASAYTDLIMPAYGPLAANFAGWISSLWGNRYGLPHRDPFDLTPTAGLADIAGPVWALDLGAGTGALANQLALVPAFSGQVIALDISAAMLSAGLNAATSLGWQLLANAEQTPFASQQFGLVCASFGLNGGHPKRLFTEARRLLRGNGLFAYQEWGGRDALSAVVDTLIDAATESIDLPEPLASYLEAPKAWYTQLQDADDHRERVKNAGFAYVWAKESDFCPVRFSSTRQFLDYKLAWATQRQRIDQLPLADQQTLYADLLAALAVHADVDGGLWWQPPLIRVCALA